MSAGSGTLAAGSGDDSLPREPAARPEVTILVNVLPPYVIQDEDGQPAGKWVDTMRTFVESRGVRPLFRFYNWRRGLMALEEGTDVMLSHVDRVPSREDKFLWIFPLEDKSYNIIARNEPAYVGLTPDTWRAFDGKTACIRNTYSCTILRDLGYPEDKIMEVYDLNYKILGPMLDRGRMDFLIEDYTWHIWANQSEGEDRFVDLFPVASVTTYMAAGKNLSPELRARLLDGANVVAGTSAQSDAPSDGPSPK